MSSFGSQVRKRLDELNRAGANVRAVIDEVAEVATLAAVEKAKANTPPNVGGLKGTNTRTGELAQSWETDSEVIPINGTTALVSNKQYASYVNDGHRMDKHFVPGLIVNGSMLERVNPDIGGIVVGTKTPYVPGYHMVEKAKGAYRAEVRKQLDRKVRELLG